MILKTPQTKAWYIHELQPVCWEVSDMIWERD